MVLVEGDIRPSTPEVIAGRLRRMILEGALAGGAQLKQNDMARQFGVSVVPVREALQRLVAEGLAVLHPNRGVMVTRLSEADFIDIAEMRALLEPHALRLSAPSLTEDDLAEAEALLRRAGASRDPVERTELHWHFHRQLYERAARPRLLGQLAHLYASINRYLLPVWSRAGLSPNWTESHLAILDALRRHHIDEACGMIADQVTQSTERVRAELLTVIDREG